jgi:predicted ATPase
LPRHQTLRATLDWSYALLAEPERIILRRLAIFAGAFSLDAALAIAAHAEMARAKVVDSLFDLVGKSLVVAEVDASSGRYRLLETTRAYALEKLAESDEFEAISRSHAEYYRALFERAEAESEQQPTAEGMADYGRYIDNVRAALDWAFSPEGDGSIGVALTAAAAPYWMHLSLMEECHNRVEQALAALRGGNGDARLEMKLLAMHAAWILHAQGPPASGR